MSNKFNYKAIPLSAFIKQPRLKNFDPDNVSIASNTDSNMTLNNCDVDDAAEVYQEDLHNYVVLMNRISSDVATMGNLGCEAAIYIRFYFLKRFNTMPYEEFKKLFSGNINNNTTKINVVEHPAMARKINLTPPDFGALIRHLCVGEASLAVQSSNNVMDTDYAALRRRANIKHKYNIKLRTHLLNDLVEKYTWFFRQHIIQSAKLLMITYYEEFYVRYIPDDDELTNFNAGNNNAAAATSGAVTANATASALQQQQQMTLNNFSKILNINNSNQHCQYQLLNIDVLIAALFSRRSRHNDPSPSNANNRALYKNYQSFFHQMFPNDTLMHDIDLYWYKYVPFLLKIQKTLVTMRPQTPVETLFPSFVDTKHFIKYDDRAIIDLLNATNLYVPSRSTTVLTTTPPSLTYGAVAALSAGDAIPYWGKLTRAHCQRFFECGQESERLFCNFVTDGVTCYRMMVTAKDECRSKATNLWSNNCCNHLYVTKRQLISLDEFHNPSHGHFSIYNYGAHLTKDYSLFAEDKLLRIHLARMKVSSGDSAINSLCTKCRNFVF